MSASSLNRASLARSASSARFRSVTFSDVMTMPPTAPARSRQGETVQLTHIRVPSARSQRLSFLSHVSPASPLR